MNGEIVKNTDGGLLRWLFEYAFRPGQLATVLVILFLLIFMGILPSPMLTAIAQVTREHNDMISVLRRICVNTAKDQAGVNQCYYVKD